jgi:hypothetical protein
VLQVAFWCKYFDGWFLGCVFVLIRLLVLTCLEAKLWTPSLLYVLCIIIKQFTWFQHSNCNHLPLFPLESLHVPWVFFFSQIYDIKKLAISFSKKIAKLVKFYTRGKKKKFQKNPNYSAVHNNKFCQKKNTAMHRKSLHQRLTFSLLLLFGYKYPWGTKGDSLSYNLCSIISSNSFVWSSWPIWPSPSFLDRGFGKEDGTLQSFLYCDL